MRFSLIREKLIKSLFGALLIICVLLFAIPHAAFSENDYYNPPEISATTAILIDTDTGEIVYEKGAGIPREPGKFAQIMTAMIAIETLSPDDVLEMDVEVYNVGGWQIFLQNGENIPVSDLIYATLLYGAADSSVALAKAVSETVDDFVVLMNERAKALGCTQTVFVNAEGLFVEEQVSTGHDLALVAQAAMKDERFRAYISQTEYTIPATYYYYARPLTNMNIALIDEDPAEMGEALAALAGMTAAPPLRIDNATGVNARRPGSQSACIVALGNRDGKNYLAIVFVDRPDTDDDQSALINMINEYADAASLLDYGFNRMREVEVFGELVGNGFNIEPGIEGLPEVITVAAGDALNLELPIALAEIWENQEFHVSYEYRLNTGLEPPLESGSAIGIIIAKAAGESIAETEMILMQNVSARRPGFMETVGLSDFRPDGLSFFLQVGAAIVILLVLILLIVLIRHRYTHDPYVRKVRYGRTTREIKRVRRLR